MTRPSPRHSLWLASLLTLGLLLPSASALSATPSGESSKKSSAKKAAKQSKVEGRVTGVGLASTRAEPLGQVKVYAYEVATYALTKVLTDRQGHFSFKSLPAGMYQIVAYKDGFAPTIELLLRKDSASRQVVDIQMEDELSASSRDAEGYWTVRGRLPADVLRDIGTSHLIPESMIMPGMNIADASAFSAEMMAMGGVEQLGGDMGDVQVTRTQVNVEGTVGNVKVGLQGSLQQLDQANAAQTLSDADADGSAHHLQLQLQHHQDSTLRVSAGGGQLKGMESAQVRPTELEHYGLEWQGATGASGTSRISARYAEENNFHQAGWLAPAEIADASRTLDVEGQYSGKVTSQTSVEAGLAYRHQVGEGYLPPGWAESSKFLGNALDLLNNSLTDESLGLYSRAETQIQPKVLIEYGLFSSVRDGNLSLTPHGGLVVQLGNDWQARTSVSHRIEDEREMPQLGFRSSFFGDRRNCQQAGEACYEVVFSQGEASQGDSISVGAVHRKFAETLRLYFNPDFFNRLESVFVVEGDSLPELQFSMVRKISPRVLARLQSNIAAGGGGIFYATDDQPYENQVRYLVTSLDTRFQNTATGIFIAFHHLEQNLNPVDQVVDVNEAASEVEMQRLQLMLTQDLNILVDVASKWAVSFNVELSRGATPYTLTPDDELRKKLTGGISVSF